jgi:alpha-methylacyl-CoA racemase
VLGHLGANIIRVDRVSGDPLEAPENRFENRPMDFLIRRSRRSIALDLKSPEARALLLRLVEQAVFAHSQYDGTGLEGQRAMTPRRADR